MSSTTHPKTAGAQPSAELIQAISALRKPLLAGHVTPDADCIGSTAGLALALKAAGIDARVSMPGPVAYKLRFLMDLAGRDLFTDGTIEGHDGLIVLDTAGAKRINAAFAFDALGDLPVINIDHHISNPSFGTHNWIDGTASSSCELVLRLIRAAGWKLDADTATLLYSGIHGDTQGFSLQNANAAALCAAADMVAAGADVVAIGERMYRSQPLSEFNLLRTVYDHTSCTDDGRISYSWLSYDDIHNAGCTAEDIDDQVNVPRSLEGVQIAMLFTEGERDVIRINLRGEGEISVLPVAQAFGGGGHAQSAGVRMKNKPMQQVISEVVAAAAKHLGA